MKCFARAQLCDRCCRCEGIRKEIGYFRVCGDKSGPCTGNYFFNTKMADMMMSERPSGSVTGAGSSMGGNAPAVSIGNYKGVMLCNRPFAGVTAAAHGARGADGKKQPFRSAVVPKEALGLNPAREQRRVNMAGPKRNKNSALSRHKKWLYQLQKAKDQFRAEAEAKEQAEADAKRKFAEQQAALRAQVRETLEDAVDQAEKELAMQDARREQLAREREERKRRQREEELAAQEEQYASKYDEGEGDIGEGVIQREQRLEREAAQRRQAAENAEDSKWFDGDEGKQDDSNAPMLTSAQQKKLAKRNKPAWAVTAEAKEAAEEQEADELLDFANNLDIDEYLDDLEVRAALEAVQDRVSRLRKEKAKMDAEDAAAEIEAKYAEGDESKNQEHFEGKEQEPLEDWGTGPQRLPLGGARLKQKRAGSRLTRDALAELAGESEGKKDMETRSVRSAQSVLSEVKSLRGIHSARSLAQLTKQTAKEMGVAAPERMPVIQESTEPFVPPKIVVINDTEGLRDEIRKQPGQLPYMHRNPAV